MRLSVFSAAAITAALLVPTLPAQPQSFPNSQKYKDSGIHNATGRSGSASIEARALFNRDETTDLEITTGSFDPHAAGAGTISHVQVQVPSGGTQNFDGSSAGTFATKVNGVGPHAQLGVQTNVRNVDGARTDVVSVSEIVKRRPDIQAVHITAPQSAVRGYNVAIRATLRELNGDTGARADLRLYADGELIDRAEGAWIDAMGVVDVSFAPIINKTGDVTLTVVADHVDPGDWDDSNNSATTHIQMVDQVGQFYSWNASAREEDSSNYHYQKYSWGEFTDDQKALNQSFEFTGYLRSQTPQTSMKASIKVTSDGNTLFDGSQDEFVQFRTWFGTCSESTSYNPEVTVCYNNNMAYTTVEIYAGAADVVYRSWGWATQRNPFSPPEPRFEWNTTYRQDTVNGRFGDSVSMNVDFEAAGSKWNAQPVIPIGAAEVRTVDRPYSCRQDWFLGQEVCEEQHLWSSTRRGSAEGF
ncbi:MAG TPA: hypothetical protein VJ032_15245 [Thermoanaerobaculia bacterium]|nr:hypothetical protein [Thermoanaerobaculia bacterium]